METYVSTNKIHNMIPKMEPVYRAFQTKAEFKAWQSEETDKIKDEYIAKYGDDFAWYDDIADTTWIIEEIAIEYWTKMNAIHRVKPIYPQEELDRLEAEAKANEKIFEDFCAECNEED